MLFLNKLSIGCLSIIVTSYISAAPAIKETSGDFQPNNTIEIIGNNFSDVDAVTLVWDTVDNQLETDTAINKKPVPYGSDLTWSENTHDDDWGTDIVYDTNDTRKGRKTSYYGVKRSDLGWPKAVKEKNLQNIYVTWWFKPNMHPWAKEGSNKFIRIWDNPSGLDTRISWTSYLLGADGIETSWGGWGGNVGEWNRLEIWANSETGELKTWVNGRLTHDATNFTKVSKTHGLNIYLIGFDPSIGDNYADFTFNMSDLYVSGSIARVEITDKPSWSDAEATREIQPIQSWSDNKVNITLNLGSFDSLSNKYLYVIDSNGEANSKGYPICSSCPVAPALLIE